MYNSVQALLSPAVLLFKPPARYYLTAPILLQFHFILFLKCGPRRKNNVLHDVSQHIYTHGADSKINSMCAINRGPGPLKCEFSKQCVTANGSQRQKNRQCRRLQVCRSRTLFSRHGEQTRKNDRVYKTQANYADKEEVDTNQQGRDRCIYTQCITVHIYSV